MLWFFLGSVAISPLDLMGSVPMSLMVIVSAATFLRFLMIDWTFLKPVHLWRSSGVKCMVLGRVELGLSMGDGVGAATGIG